MACPVKINVDQLLNKNSESVVSMKAQTSTSFSSSSVVLKSHAVSSASTPKKVSSNEEVQKSNTEVALQSSQSEVTSKSTTSSSIESTKNSSSSLSSQSKKSQNDSSIKNSQKKTPVLTSVSSTQSRSKVEDPSVALNVTSTQKDSSLMTTSKSTSKVTSNNAIASHSSSMKTTSTSGIKDVANNSKKSSQTLKEKVGEISSKTAPVVSTAQKSTTKPSTVTENNTIPKNNDHKAPKVAQIINNKLTPSHTLVTKTPIITNNVKNDSESTEKTVAKNSDDRQNATLASNVKNASYTFNFSMQGKNGSEIRPSMSFIYSNKEKVEKHINPIVQELEAQGYKYVYYKMDTQVVSNGTYGMYTIDVYFTKKVKPVSVIYQTTDGEQLGTGSVTYTNGASQTDSTPDIGDTYTTTARTFTGYHLTQTPANATGTVSDNAQTVAYTYAPDTGQFKV